jgi:hypothetical protein
MTPGTQDIYKELRRGQRHETGFYPVTPEVARHMATAFTGKFGSFVDEAFNRSYQDPEWLKPDWLEKKSDLMSSRAKKLLSD